VKGECVHDSVVRSRPGLSLEELHQLKWALGSLVALVGVASALFFDIGGRALLPFAALAIVGAMLRPDLPLRVPPLAWRLAFPGLVAFVGTDIALNGEVLAALVRLNILLVTVRAIAPRRQRDDLQLIVLALFLIVVAGVLTVSIGFALQILLFTACALGFLVAITLVESVQGDAPPPPDWAAVSWPRFGRRLLAVTDWRMIGFAGVLFVLVVALSSALFLAIPRFQLENSLGFLNLRNKRSLTGFSDTVRFGDVTNILQDNSMALRVEVTDPSIVPAEPYWRMVVLDAYEDGVYRASGGLRRGERFSRGTESIIEGLRPDAAEDEAVWTFYLEAGVSRYLPLTGPFARLRLRDRLPVGFLRRVGVVALRDEPQTMFAYRVEGMDLRGEYPDPFLPEQIRRAERREAEELEAGFEEDGVSITRYPLTLLQVPSGEENRAVLDRIVHQITGGGALEAREFARRAVDYLGDHHRYSLVSSLPPGEADPLVRWLAGGGAGHCEYFAGAFTVLARHAGFPVRVVTGFKGGTWNAFENYFMVRNADAHAWCEMFADGVWFRVDPTPGAELNAAILAGSIGQPAQIDRSWRARMDSVRVMWYRRIVSFDQRAQSEVIETVRTFTREGSHNLLEGLRRAALQLRAWLLQPWDLGRLTGWLVAIATLTFAAWVSVRYRFLLAWRAGGRRLDPVRRQAGKWLARLRAEGLGQPDQPPVADLLRLRFGAGGSPIEALPVFNRARREWQERRRRHR
jgi:transglutaminase-like putative cysteine protease